MDRITKSLVNDFLKQHEIKSESESKDFEKIIIDENGNVKNIFYDNNRDLPGMENVNIPPRLIVTSDENIKNQITIATNSQTEIKPEQLAAISEFQKNLEQYYDTIEGTGQLFYERLTNQYSQDNSVTKTRIITIPIQIKVFSAMF